MRVLLHDDLGRPQWLTRKLEATLATEGRRDGVAGFLVRYLWAYLRWRLRRHPHWAAYRRIPFEAEAEWLARRTNPVSGDKGQGNPGHMSPETGGIRSRGR